MRRTILCGIIIGLLLLAGRLAPLGPPAGAAPDQRATLTPLPSATSTPRVTPSATPTVRGWAALPYIVKGHP